MAIIRLVLSAYRWCNVLSNELLDILDWKARMPRPCCVVRRGKHLRRANDALRRWHGRRRHLKASHRCVQADVNCFGPYRHLIQSWRWLLGSYLPLDRLPSTSLRSAPPFAMRCLWKPAASVRSTVSWITWVRRVAWCRRNPFRCILLQNSFWRQKITGSCD